MLNKPKRKKRKRREFTDIPQVVKERVWERDEKSCIICGNKINVMPNAHYIPRSKGGLGIERNIVTLCTELTPNKCHRRYDFGTRKERKEIGEKIKKYLMSKYDDWDESKLVFKKWDDYK